MKFSTQAAVAATLAAALLAGPALAQSQFNRAAPDHRQGPLPPTGSASDYQAPRAQQQMPGAATTSRAMTASKRGSESVRALQSALNAQAGANLKVDGIMGAQTRAALKKYQTTNNLKTEAEARTKLGVASTTTTGPARSTMPSTSTPPRSSSSSTAMPPASRSAPMGTSPSTPSSSGSRAIEPAKPNNSGSAPSPANTPSKM
jgi:peptidoglycan hydrolase-like protein with peptidoglycan-binding domain